MYKKLESKWKLVCMCVDFSPVSGSIVYFFAKILLCFCVVLCFFFSAIKNELWLFLIPAGLAVILLGVFLEEVGFFLRNISSFRRQFLYLWILGMYPVTAVSSYTHTNTELLL